MLNPPTFTLIMFSSVGAFKPIQCPEQPHCSLLTCIFSHHVPSQSTGSKRRRKESSANVTLNGQSLKSSQSPSSRDSDDESVDKPDKPRKRSRLSSTIDSKHELQFNSSNGPRRQPLATHQAHAGIESSNPPITAVKEVSPPPSRFFKTKAAAHLLAKAEAASRTKSVAEPKPNKFSGAASKKLEISLNPRQLRNPPAPHAVRIQLITMMHEQMSRLNEELQQSEDLSKSTLRLSPEDLIIAALNEEEKIAKQNPTVYLNVVKLRITKLRKLKLAEWKEERLKQVRKDSPDRDPGESKRTPGLIETGLSTQQEIAFLSRMLAKQNELANFGYVAVAPTEEEVSKAREGLEASQGWEQCDRCKTRFQVYPGRREEDGALTSGGTCSYHPGKLRRLLPKDRADKVHRDSIYACCNEAVGTSIGCAAAPTHVFKISDPKRLALIMPFKETPPKPATFELDRAICFDCEMGYTTKGLELIRITATSWPKGEALLDVLVRPLGEILDLNSQFSGVWPINYTDALPYTSSVEGKERNSEGWPESQLRFVESPVIARDLLFDLLTPETPLIGHALDNDLNATRIIHPSIVDSVLLYPHPRGLPIRFGLKMLMKRHLDRDIQMGGADGHDSKEDARAAGDLVRLKVADLWKAMQKDGWSVREQVFCPPVS